MRGFLLAVCAAMLLLLAGCSGSDEVAEGAARDRIVIATGDGQVYTVNPEGADRVDLALGGDAGTGLQPVWSPDGTRIAWSQRDAEGFAIISANPDGTEQMRADTLFSGYFGYWDPTSTQLGFLGNAPPGTGLVLDDGTGAELNQVVDSDTFYYFSWSPDGTQWVVHSGSGFSIVDLDGTSTELDLRPAPFRAPTWAPDGTVLLALSTGGGNVIARYDASTGEVEELLDVGAVANFVLDPTGRFLAVESRQAVVDQTQPGQGTQVSFQQPLAEVAQVLVHDLQSGTTRQVFDERTGGFWWSPDGTKLALLVGEAGANPSAAQWLVWSLDESFRTQAFQPTRTFATTYVPFFDQFAQSVTPWSPDSRRFVFAGTVDDESGVFVQPAQADAPATLIASESGGVAFWSPT